MEELVLKRFWMTVLQEFLKIKTKWLQKEFLIKLLEIKGILDKYVILKEDEKGRYIEYAFKEGSPKDNRCLSWYDKPHPNARVRNGYKANYPIHEINKIYELDYFLVEIKTKKEMNIVQQVILKRDVYSKDVLNIGHMKNQLNVHVGFCTNLVLLVLMIFLFLECQFQN